MIMINVKDLRWLAFNMTTRLRSGPQQKYLTVKDEVAKTDTKQDLLRSRQNVAHVTRALLQQRDKTFLNTEHLDAEHLNAQMSD